MDAAEITIAAGRNHSPWSRVIATVNAGFFVQRLEIPGLKEKDLPDNQQVSFHCGCNIYTNFSQYIAHDGRDNNGDSTASYT